MSSAAFGRDSYASASPNPISLLSTLFTKPHQPVLHIAGSEQIDIKTQIQCLQPTKCDTVVHRNDVIRALNIADLEKNASKRIRFKSILFEYHKHWRLIHLDHFKPLQDWDHHDFAVNAVVFFMAKADADISSADANPQKIEKNLKNTWLFLDYLFKYFRQSAFDGNEFISMAKQADEDLQKAQRSLGLTITKRVLAQFGLKGGPFTSPRKQMTPWVKQNVDRYERERTFDLDEYVKQQLAVAEPENHDPFGSGAAAVAAENHQKSNMNTDVSAVAAPANDKGVTDGERWYWFDQDFITWVPYRDEQQKVIEEAWKNNDSGVIVMVDTRKLKIEFNRQDPKTGPQQFNCEIAQAWRRQVIRSKPDSNNLINDFQCSEHPK